MSWLVCEYHYMQKYNTIIYKNPWILVSMRILETAPPWIARNCCDVYVRLVLKTDLALAALSGHCVFNVFLPAFLV